MKEVDTIKIFLGMIALAIVVFILKELKTIFIPLTFAIFLAFMFQPLNRFLQSKRIPVEITILLMVIIILITFTLMGTVVYTSISSFVTEFPKYEQKITEMFQDFIITFEIPVEKVTDYLKNKVNWFELAQKFSLSKIISGTMGTFVDFMTKLLLTVAFMIFIVLERSKMIKRVEKVMTKNEAEHSVTLVMKIEQSVKTYIVNKTIISLITGLISMLFIAVLGIDFVVISGILIFILNYIPNLGSIIASAFPMIICFIQYGFNWQLIAIATALISTQMIMGNFVEPKMMGTGLKLSPLFVLIALIFWFWVWGPVGMILAIPITSTFSLIIKEIPSLKIISAFISSE